MSSKDSASSNSRDLLLQGALEEFAAEGFRAATTRNIAARVGMSNGIIRYHYETKEKLWFAAVEFLFNRLTAEVGGSPKEHAAVLNGDVDVFRTWIKRYVYYCAAHPEHAKIIYRESASSSGRLKVAVNKHIRKSHNDVASYISAMKKAGVFPKHAPAASILYIIAGASQNIFALASECEMSLGYDSLSENAIEAHAKTVVDIICPKK